MTSDQPPAKVLAVMVCDLDTSPIGTRSRLADPFPSHHPAAAESPGPGWRSATSTAPQPVLQRTLERLSQIQGVTEITLLALPDQIDRLWRIIGPQDRVQIRELHPRSPSLDARVRSARAWNLLSWRGGAGQFTVFDEDYHPASIAQAASAAFNNTGADHVLLAPAHAVFLDPAITSALIHHHLHKNHEMRVTYTPAAPGLSGMLLRADIVREMGEKNFLPGQLLAYDPKAPAFDTLIREACMQVDPALSKIPNRFCVDTDRTWQCCAELARHTFDTAAELCLAAARAVAPGVKDLSRAFDWPREIQIELTAQRLTQPPGAPPPTARAAQSLDPAHWSRWFARQPLCDDLLLTFGGDGDPLHYPGLLQVLRAARSASPQKPLAICLQTDLASASLDPLLAAISENLIDVLTISMYGHTAPTYARVAGADLHAQVLANMEKLASVITKHGGVPLVVPRLLKVRDTLPELEPFFDFWIERTGWAVIDYPTDRAGSVPFAGVVDMAPPKRRPCRRLWDRLVIRPDGAALACDQDVFAKLRLGVIEGATIRDMWAALDPLRQTHAAGRWNELDPCRTCREWHRA